MDYFYKPHDTDVILPTNRRTKMLKSTKLMIAGLFAALAMPVFANPLGQVQKWTEDRVKIDGTIRARFDSVEVEKARANSRHLNADLWLSARLYQDWTAKMEIEPQLNLKTGKMNGDQDIPMNKLFIEGTVYDQVKLRAGKFGAFSSYGRVLDNEVTGGELSFNYGGLPTKVTVGRVTKIFNDNGLGVGVHRNAIAAVQSKYALTPRTNLGATLTYVKNTETPTGKKDAWFGEVGADTQFAPDLSAMAAYSVSNLDDVRNVAGKKVSNHGVFAGVKYKNADWGKAQSYDVFMNVRHVGAMSGVSSVEDYSKNVQGIQIGANYVPYKNVKLNAFYLHGKEVDNFAGAKKQKINVFRAQAEYKF